MVPGCKHHNHNAHRAQNLNPVSQTKTNQIQAPVGRPLTWGMADWPFLGLPSCRWTCARELGGDGHGTEAPSDDPLPPLRRTPSASTKPESSDLRRAVRAVGRQRQTPVHPRSVPTTQSTMGAASQCVLPLR